MRGTGSLQLLLGRSHNAKKRTRAQAGGGPAIRPPALALAQLPAEPSAEQRPLPAGRVRCPVCQAELPDALDAVNLHLDKCLTRQASGGRSLQQASMLQFAQRPPPARMPPAGDDSEGSWDSEGSEAPSPSRSAQPRGSQGHGAPDQPATCSSGRGGGASTPLSAAAGQSPDASPSQVQLHCFECCIVGRQFQQDAHCHAGQRAAVEPEAGNPSDAHALLARDAEGGRPLGHLPRRVAAHLGPLLRSGAASAEAVVLEAPAGPRAPLLVELQVWVAPMASPAGGQDSPARWARAALDRCREEAARSAARPAVGERLRAAFLSLVDDVLAQDGHLLDPWELAWVAGFKALPVPAQCLFVRLFQRQGPWFRLGALCYPDVPSVRDAAAALAAASVAALVEPGAHAAPHCRPRGALPGPGDLAGVLALPELGAALRVAKGGCGAPAGAPRPQVLAAIAHQASQGAAVQERLLAALMDAAGPLVRLEERACETVGRIQRLFFLNEGQTLSQVRSLHRVPCAPGGRLGTALLPARDRAPRYNPLPLRCARGVHCRGRRWAAVPCVCGPALAQRVC